MVCEEESGEGSGDDETTTQSGAVGLMASLTLAVGLALVSSVMRALTH